MFKKLLTRQKRKFQEFYGVLSIKISTVFHTSAKPEADSGEVNELASEEPISVEKRAWNFNSRGYNRGYRQNKHAQFKRQLYDYLKQHKNAYRKI